jgi:uncharacterized protein YbjT (DUF2867 family)
LIAVIGATGQQGGGVVLALQASSEFKVRARPRSRQASPTRRWGRQRGPGPPRNTRAAFKGAYGVSLVTNFREAGTGEFKQATAAVRAAKDAGVKHFVWSTLPNVEAISGGKFDVPHFTGKAKVDRIVEEAGFPHHTFVIAPGYYQNFVRFLASQKQSDGSGGWALPLNPDVRCLHMGDIRELGDVVAGAFAHPGQAGSGEYLPLVGDFLSFNEIVETLNRQGHHLSYRQIPKEIFAGAFPGAAEVAEMISYWEAHTYLGSDSSDQIALTRKIAGRRPTPFSTWARVNFPA